MTRVIGLFPTPLIKIDGFLDAELTESFTALAQGQRRSSNSATDLLSHTTMIKPHEDAACAKLADRVLEPVQQFGELLFAERLQWTIKEMWLNVLEPGGSQFLHTHANSFISGVVYVNTPSPANGTLFRKVSGGGEYIFRNDVPMGHYSSDTWMLQDAQAGDLVLFPSYMLHGVTPNEGDLRITLAFNAIPDHLDSLGYRIRFQSD
jgi:uncharacterized protein (TIGR02466 family)